MAEEGKKEIDISTGKHLWWISGAPHGWSIMALLAHKGISYHSRTLSFQNGENKGSDVLALNPRGELPIFVDDGEVLTEHLAILFHIELTYREQPVLSDEPVERARVLKRLFECGNLWHAMFSIARQYQSAREGATTELQGNYRKIYNELDTWESYLAEGVEFCAGTQTVSLADLRLYPILKFLERVGLEYDERFDHIVEYMERLGNMAIFQDTYPPHWRDNAPNLDLFHHVDTYSERDAAAIDAVRFIGYK
eukprot:TRINITY_DN19517_c0_g1_i1.p1 TRINITY_DN19517_c0_g1~~TRINITY_DN19517_c0_g1_i1.p1  ORF type:complete len:252 (-),score=27.59 TRINITY_DN19517_c0_g1_i1:199-954(-)